MKNVWLLLGPEVGLKKNEIEKIKRSIVNSLPAGEELETIKFFCSDDAIGAMEQEIAMVSLFSSYKLILIFQADNLSASDSKILLATLQSMPETSFVVFESEQSKVDATLTKSVAKNNKKVFWALSESEYADYVVKEAMRMGYNMFLDAAELLVQFYGSNTMELSAILAQVITFCNSDLREERSIHAEDIRLWLNYHKPETVFKLFEGIAHGQYEDAFLILVSLLRTGEHSAQLMAGLVYQIRNALKIKRGLDSGVRLYDVCASLYIKNFVTQKSYAAFVDNCSQKCLRHMLELCVSTEEELRSGGDAKIHEVILSRLIYHVCMMHRDSSYEPFTGKQNSYYNISNTYLYDW